MRKLDGLRVDALVILGSGLSGAFDDDELELVEDLGSGIAGHRGRLALWRRDATTVLVALGRTHLYEGIEPREAASIVDRAASHGAAHLIVTNAAGGLNPRYLVGDIMMIAGINALLIGARLPSLHTGATSESGRHTRQAIGRASGQAFDRVALDDVAAHALERGLQLQCGTYAAVLGPSYETRAEIRMLRIMGADAVGMSTVPEYLAARRHGMLVTGFSLITNMLSDTTLQELDHTDVVVAGNRARRSMRVAIEAALAAATRRDH